METNQILLSVGGGVVFILLLLVLAIKFPHPSEFLHGIARVTLALAAAAVAAGLTGFISLKLQMTNGGSLIQAGGSLAVFVAVYFFDPAGRVTVPTETDNQNDSASGVGIPAIAPRPGTYYFIENARSGKVVTNPNKRKRALVVQMENEGSDGQQWEFIPTGEGHYRVVSKLVDYVLDVEGGVKDPRSKQNGRGIITWSWPESKGPHQQWRLAAAGVDSCKIVSRWSSKVLDVEGGKNADGARIVQWEDNGQSSQCWKLIPVK